MDDNLVFINVSEKFTQNHLHSIHYLNIKATIENYKYLEDVFNKYR